MTEILTQGQRLALREEWRSACMAPPEEAAR